MKNYAEYPHASVSMSNDALFVTELNKLFLNNNISNIIESGTYIGLGSTTTLAKAIVNSLKPYPKFVTLEVDINNLKAAKKNLAKYRHFITPTWALSVSKSAAVDFIKTDDAIANHEKYPDVFIDRLEKPQQFYLDEVEGQLFKTEVKVGFPQKLMQKIGLVPTENFVEGFFEKNIPQIKEKKPLFLLDSAGGLGYLEFQTMHRLMDGNSYFLILDDIHHLKHFRSYQDIQSNPQFTILAKNIENGWLIAEYKK